MIEKTTSDSIKINNRQFKAIQSGKKKSLAEVFPEIAKEWCYEKNGDLTPEMVTYGSAKKFFWKCPEGHVYTAAINSKTCSKTGCPYCSGRYPIEGKTDLATTHPALASEWCYEKNAPLTPKMVTAGSGKKVWWQCEYGHEWPTTISSRTFNGNGCPYCSGRLAIPGKTSLSVTHPALAAEWHRTKNGDLTPEKVSKGSTKKVWWKCEHGHEWEAQINARSHGNGCPYCSLHGTSIPELTLLYYIQKHIDSNAVHRYRDLGFELDIYIPKLKVGIEYDGVFYHKNKINQDLHKNKSCQKNGITLYRIREIPLSNLEDGLSIDLLYNPHKNNEFVSTIKKLLNLLDKEIHIDIKTNIADINRFLKLSKINKTLFEEHPALAEEWHPTKNGDLTPEMVLAGCNDKVWWLGKCGHEWKSVIRSRTKGHGCPYCSGKKMLSGFNDLATVYPELAKEWHTTKNGSLTPKMVTAGSHLKVWWQCENGHEWQARVNSRTSCKSGCPYCAGRKVFVGFNDLTTKKPDIAKQWHPNRNGDLTPEMVSAGSRKKVWWQCPHCGHEYQRVIKNQTNKDLNLRCFHCKTPVNTAKSA